MGEVITTILNATPDPQRGTRLTADPALYETLAASVARHGHRLTVLTDCLPAAITDTVTTVAVEPGANPYFHRWRAIAGYLRLQGHDDPVVWCVDATDVEMLTDPFDHVDARLHIGSENDVVGSSWMRATNPGQAAWIHDHAALPLLNPGIVGGARRVVEAFARAVAALEGRNDMTDMGAANEAAYELWPDHVTGGPVHTTYKADAATPGCWWKHK